MKRAGSDSIDSHREQLPMRLQDIFQQVLFLQLVTLPRVSVDALSLARFKKEREREREISMIYIYILCIYSYMMYIYMRH